MNVDAAAEMSRGKLNSVPIFLTDETSQDIEIDIGGYPLGRCVFTDEQTGDCVNVGCR